MLTAGIHSNLNHLILASLNLKIKYFFGIIRSFVHTVRTILTKEIVLVLVAVTHLCEHNLLGRVVSAYYGNGLCLSTLKWLGNQKVDF